MTLLNVLQSCFLRPQSCKIRYPKPTRRTYAMSGQECGIGFDGGNRDGDRLYDNLILLKVAADK